MMIGALADLFQYSIKDTRFAEVEVWRVLPNFIVKVGNSKLRGIFEDHLDQTAIHIDRLVNIHQQLGYQISAGRCVPASIILDETIDIIDEIDDKTNLDTILVATIDAINHFQIMRYSTLCVWAEKLDHSEILTDLKKTLLEKRTLPLCPMASKSFFKSTLPLPPDTHKQIIP